MSVDTKNRHFECKKCGNVFSHSEQYSAKNEICSGGGSHNLKVVQAHWDNSALGATINILGRGVKAGVNKAAEYNSEEAQEAREMKKQLDEIKRQNQEQERAIQDAEQKIKDQELAEKTRKVYTFIKPYLKFIIPVYLIAFSLTLFFVKKKILVAVFFGLPVVGAGYLVYNVIVNKPKNN